MKTLEELKEALVGNYICEHAVVIGRIESIKEAYGTQGLYCILMQSQSMATEFLTRRCEFFISAEQLERLANGEEVQLSWETRRTAIFRIANKDGAAKTCIPNPEEFNGKEWHDGTLLGNLPSAFVKKAVDDYNARSRYFRNLTEAYDDISNADWFDENRMNLFMEMPSFIAYIIDDLDFVVKSYGRDEEIDNSEKYKKR